MIQKHFRSLSTADEPGDVGLTYEKKNFKIHSNVYEFLCAPLYVYTNILMHTYKYLHMYVSTPGKCKIINCHLPI